MSGIGKKMSKSLLPLILIASMLVQPAQAQSPIAQPQRVWVNADSPLYGVKLTLEEVLAFPITQLFFAGDTVSYRLALAERRLTEIEDLVARAKTQHVTGVGAEYSKQIMKAETLFHEKEPAQHAEIAEKLTTHYVVLAGIRERAPEEAYYGLDAAINASRMGAETALRVLEAHGLPVDVEHIRRRLEDPRGGR